MKAPLYAVAEGPEGGEAFFVKAADGVRLRMGLWREGAAGTVLLIPGRTEYIEKYGRAAQDLRVRGFACLVIDVRGQGLSDRPLGDRMSGHVGDFAEYQLDIDAMLDFAQIQGLPAPYYLMSHSMGGAIALRALMRGIDVKATAFCAPMWGISLAAWLRPVAVAVSTASRWFGLDGRYAPGTGPNTYVLSQGFAGNSLTTDQPMWDYMRDQVLAHPELALGGPTLRWLNAALAECAQLSLMRAPDMPCYCALGTAERIVDVPPIHARMMGWPKGQLQMFAGAEHEVIMEIPATRAQFFDQACALFKANP